MNAKGLFAIFSTFVGCCSNVIFLELLIREDPGSGNLVTFLQFVFIALEGFIFTSKFGTKKPVIALKDYAVLVLMFFVTSVLNNYAFNFNIPMPLHMIFRAGSLIANMTLGILILKKRYTLSKYVSVILITIGVITCTFASGWNVKASIGANLDKAQNESDQSNVFWWIVGIVLLSVALLISARMGIYQEVIYKRFGKHPREALFYTHLLPIPGFFLMYRNIWEHLVITTASPPFYISLFAGYHIKIPIALIYMLLNVVTQYVCISSVYVLTAEYSSLTVTLVVTLRKFVSLLFSIWYFTNPFTVFHWFGTFLVMIGTLTFADVIPFSLNKSQIKKKNVKLQ